MTWSLRREDATITEWERSDGYATVRLRERGDGRFVVRLDVMEQAVDARAYDRVLFDERDAAEERAGVWREEHDLDD
ncbi:hypothetical protein DQW50_15735 [Halorubrum sp. 48-1-W]|uniref:DUF7543 family protein n=1 Tax=Halorubrum sp. 48-1-W TaxID=2249761 RepID=UPI000DCD23A4|nr:hypothetical protein [Halorubrum sp. 48-1-W]RAW44202.1 hypothetical protein DQW50_15735 [Halorubrum sp. 48-1-W]